jgi:hypothetical protein
MTSSSASLVHASASGVTYKSDILEIKCFNDGCQVVGVSIHVVPGRSLARAAMATPVVCHNAKSILGEEQHLSVPCIRIQRQPVRKRDDRALAQSL